MKTQSLIWLTGLPFCFAIWPAPVSESLGDGTIWLSESTDFVIRGFSTGHNTLNQNISLPTKRDIIDAAIQRTKDGLFRQNFIPWKFRAQNSLFEPPIVEKRMIQNIILQELESNRNQNSSGDNESYQLHINADGTTTITAATAIGISHGLSTFVQLFYEHSRGGIYCPFVPVDIKDSPTFEYRGVNLDVARNFFPIRSIKRLIDTMAFNKFNKLHIHATDSQSWPLEIPSLPDLAGKGAYYSGLSYSPANLADLQRYGAMQGVEVFLEIDIPGHTASIWHGYPDLIASYNILPDWSRYAAEPPSGTLKLNSSKVDAFMDTLLNDLLPRVVPYNKYFHTGGDELNFESYSKDETINLTSSMSIKPYLQAFVEKVHSKIRAAGLTPIVWQEMVTEYNLNLGKDVIVQAWQGGSSAAEFATSLGHRVIAGSSDSWYLDCGLGQWLNSNDTSTPTFHGCSPKQNWRVMYNYDPLLNIPEQQKKLVIGGEVHIWTEQIDPYSLDTVVWPRASAAGEILWTGKNQSQVEAAVRLSEFRERLVHRGIMAENIQMPFCTQNKRHCQS